QDDIHSGTIYINNEPVEVKTPMDAITKSIAYVPAERKTEGLILNQSVAVNTMVAHYTKSKQIFTDRKKDNDISKKWIELLSTKTPSVETLVESLSGGNQQKVVLAKWLELSPDILILNEPTRGIDVGAKAEIYKILNQLCKSNKCVIIITSEMPELLAMSDNIMVMFEGKVSGFLNAKEANQEKVVQYAIGG
ncbi:MAG TPA: sugar ABC transporter ATP-binding protein, partial [Clostridiales bacterium]|nr:sugar ABC transporter ATP-binding protein [Clostridiales bacterium]